MYVTVIDGIYGDDYQVHRCLKKVFDGQNILFQRRNALTHVLSGRPCDRQGTTSTRIDHVISRIKTGDQIDFTLRINPVVSKRCDPAKKRGVLKAIPSRDNERWLNNRFIQNGFMADYALTEEGFRESEKDGNRIMLNSLMVKGTLDVMNADSVRKALVAGIGRGKGLGFGFLHVYDQFISL